MSEVVIYDLLRPENIRRTDAGLDVTEPGQGSGVISMVKPGEKIVLREVQNSPVELC